MFNIGTGEIALIAVVALLLLGPERLPELARGIGKFIREFRRQTDDVRNVVEREFYRLDEEVRREDAPKLAAPPDTVSATKFVPPNKRPAALPSDAEPLAEGDSQPTGAAAAPEEPLPEPEPFKSQVTAGMPEEKK